MHSKRQFLLRIQQTVLRRRNLTYKSRFLFENIDRSSEGTTIEDYFKRYEWALQLSKISDDWNANSMRVHMGTELNNALKFLVALREPESLTYEVIRRLLITHFDRVQNKYAESVKFRKIKQQKDESIASFSLRLRQGAALCEYRDFLDRMLIDTGAYYTKTIFIRRGW